MRFLKPFSFVLNLLRKRELFIVHFLDILVCLHVSRVENYKFAILICGQLQRKREAGRNLR